MAGDVEIPHVYVTPGNFNGRSRSGPHLTRMLAQGQKRNGFSEPYSHVQRYRKLKNIIMGDETGVLPF
jgi:hypothetical protein